MRWFTSDLHFGHTNIIGYCNRPFHSVGEMDAALVALWNSLVQPNDEVWVLGDLAMGRIAESMPIAGQLIGTKHLIVGNHDRPFGEQQRAIWTDRYLKDGGFASIHHGEIDLWLTPGLQVRLCHFPYLDDSRDGDRFADRQPVDDGRWLLHGHVHQKWRQRGRMINVGIDVWAGQPVPQEVIVKMIESGARDLDRFNW